MRFVFTLEQRDFFRKNHFIEFEGMLSSKQAALIDKEAQELLSGRLRTPFSQWDTLPPLALYKAGFDLWREALAIRKATQKLPIVHIASELFDTAPLRIRPILPHLFSSSSLSKKFLLNRNLQH